MSSGTKVALVALMVLMMVVIARLVNDGSSVDGVGDPEVGGLNAETEGEAGVAGKGTRAAAGRDGLAARKPDARSLSSQKAPKEDVHISANPSRRSPRSALPGDPRRLTDPRTLDPSRSRSGTGSSAAPGEQRMTLPRVPDAVPISGAPDGDELTSRETTARAEERGGPAPVSIEGAARAAASDPTPAELVRSLQTPVVNTQLDVGGTATAESSRAPESTSSSIGASGERPTSLARSAQRRSTPAVPVKSYNVSKPSGSSSPDAGSPRSDFPVSYTIQPDDNLWNIAKKYYGQGHLYKQIVARNPGVKIQPGQTLIIPAPASAPGDRAAETTSAAPGSRRYGNAPTRTGTRPSQTRTHTVRRGETLWEIAGRAYGDPTLWVRIKNANPSLKSGDDIKAGMTIVIP